ncbi:MAG TPA: Gfo/Idh/MocA family oxidoreductase, partial [Nitrospirae bacterium]|nr:Gfo/Idh/MocA family oxidoreductase [Nitrospirota bacterium]
AAESGVKGIYCEKPVALNLKQARGMIRACEKNNVALVVGHERRWDARFRIIRDMLNNGELGKLSSITGYTLSSRPPKLSRRKHGGGTMFHDGTHLVDLFNFFAGDPEYVIGLADRPYGKGYVESTALGIIGYKNGVRGMILGGGERKYFHFEIDIQTDSSRILLGNHISELYMSSQSERYTGFTELKKVPFPNGLSHVNAFIGGVTDLIHEMETGETSISCGRDGYKALETIFALYRSAGKGGALVKLPL